MTTPEERVAYWAEKKAQHERALAFLSEAKPGETYRIERYAITEVGVPHALSRFAHVRDKRTVKINAVHNGGGAYWFTTSTGEAIEADTMIKWQKLPEQQGLGL